MWRMTESREKIFFFDSYIHVAFSDYTFVVACFCKILAVCSKLERKIIYSKKLYSHRQQATGLNLKTRKYICLYLIF